MDRRLDSIFFLIGYILCLLMGGGNCQISDTERNQPGETSSPSSIISSTTTEPSPATELLTSTSTELHNVTNLSTTHSSPEANQESETDTTILINILHLTGTQTEVEFTTSPSTSPYTQTTQYPPYTEVRVAAEQDTDHFTLTSTQHDRDTSPTDTTISSTLRSSLVSHTKASTTIPPLSTIHSEESTHVVANVSSTSEPIKTGESTTVISTTINTESTSPITSIPSSSDFIIASTLENTTTILSTTPNGTTQPTQTEISTPLVTTISQATTYPIKTKKSEFITYSTTLPSITQSNILQEVTDLNTGDDVAISSVPASLPDPDAHNTTREVISRTDIQRVYWTKNEIIVVIVVMFVLNVFNLIVVVLCVMHIVNHRSQRWEPPPTRFGSRSRYTNSRPQLECVRTISGCDLATDSQCKSEEKPLQTVSIISKDSGWCVPIEEQKKKADQTADTGV